MSGSVLTALAGVLVTAVLGALAVIREQSIIRQLERITAILKDTPSDAGARSHLEWLRDDMARRLNFQYRAPRQRGRLFLGWVGVLYGAGSLGLIYILMVAITVTAAGNLAGKSLPLWAVLIEWAALVVISFGLFRSGYRTLVRRARRRMRWVIKHPNRGAGGSF